MALINTIVKTSDEPKSNTGVQADFNFNKSVLTIRTYKAGDINRKNGAKQNIQLDKDMAKKLCNILNDFIGYK